MDREKETIEKSRKTYNRGMVISILVNLMNIGLIFLVLNTENKGTGHYIGLVVLVLVQLLYIFMLRYGVKLRKNSIKSIVDFFEQNPQYRQYHSNNDISKNISIIDNYIFLINGAKIIDLNKSSNFEFYTSRYHHQLFQTNYSLAFDNDDKRESVFLGPLSSVGLEKFKNYISNYEKLKV